MNQVVLANALAFTCLATFPFLGALPARSQAPAPPRSVERLDQGWRFHYGDAPGAERPDFNDARWRSVDLPHDFSIEDLPPLTADTTPVLAVASGDWKFQLGDDPGWKAPDLDDSGWQTVQLPTHWSTHVKGELVNKFGWYRRRLPAQPTLAGQAVVLLLGKVDDVDETFVNGVKVGQTGDFPPAYSTAWTVNRRYQVPAQLLKGDGTDVVAVRDYNGQGDAGIYEAAGPERRSGPFDSQAPGGASQGYSVGAVAWYRQTIPTPRDLHGRRVSVNFEGVYMNAQFWLNGHPLGTHPYGYTSFSCDLTPFLSAGGKNVLSVRVDSTGLNSRWYSGSGLYRHVWLTVTEPVHIGEWGVSVTTSNLDANQSTVHVRTSIHSELPATQAITLKSEILDAQGRTVGTSSASGSIAAQSSTVEDQQIVVSNPRLWSPDDPALYRLVSTVTRDGHILDQTETPFGIRSISFDAKNGFLLNGVETKLRGGCVHHDDGPLGSAAYDRAEERRIELLKAAGFNAIRTSHNPPSPAFLEACDRLGMLIMDEAFDCWMIGKNPQDYGRFFNDWWRRDLDGMIHRDRNHPCVILWSIGNEIPGQTTPEGAARAAELANEVRAQDPTRPVTQATNPDRDLLDPLLEHLDVVGYNYAADRFANDETKHPGRIFVQTESFPGACADAWQIALAHPYVVGDFVWTALDYIGEAGIGRDIYPGDNGDYAGAYPCTVSGCGDLDLTGFRKPQSYYRGIVWGIGPSVAAFVDAVAAGQPSYRISGWGWPDDRASWTWPGTEGTNRTVRVYARTPKVKLILNGRALEEKPTNPANHFTATYQVPYEPGQLDAVGLDDQGNETARWTLKTSGTPAGLRLTPDRSAIHADAEDLAYITIELVDKDGNRCTDATNSVACSLSGPGKLLALASANIYNTESFQNSKHAAYQGRLLAVLKAGASPGTAVLKATVPGLPAVETAISFK
jgi:beta-galactosidase